MADVDSDGGSCRSGGLSQTAAPSSRSHDPASSRRTDIQGLRALAVLMVVVDHARLPLPGGFTGVDVFFVISGFVITAMLLREWRASGRIDLVHFYVRRSLRLMPALALVVACVMLAALVAPSPFASAQTTARTAIGALCFAANLVIARAAGDYFAEAAAENPLLHTWSLSVEEQFYLVFPISLIGALALGRAVGRPRLVPVATFALGTAASFAVSVAWVGGSELGAGWTEAFGGPTVFAFYALPSRAWEFGVGALLAFAADRGLEPSRAFREGAGVLGLGLIAGSALLLDGAAAFPGGLAALPVAGAALALIAGSGAGSISSRALAVRPLVAIGDGSYSIYLWHWPLIVIAGQTFPEQAHAPVAAAAVAFLPAWLSQRRVEQPLRAWRPRAAFAAVRVLLAIAVVPIALAGAVLVADEEGGAEEVAHSDDGEALRLAAHRRNPRAWREAHALVAAGCVNRDLDPVGCRFGPAPAQGTILLLGDSSAYALADGVIAAAAELGHAVVASSIEGCPFLQRRSTVPDRPECPSWQDHALEYALATRPAAVVIANRTSGYLHPKAGWLTVIDEQGHRARTVEQAAEIWRRGLEDVILPLRDAGIPVLVVAPIAPMPHTASRRTILAQAYGGEPIGVSLQEALAYRQPAFDVETAVVARHPRAAIFDPLSVLCRPVCASAAGSTVLYQDTTHLSVDGSLRLAPGLRAALESILRPAVTSL